MKRLFFYLLLFSVFSAAFGIEDSESFLGRDKERVKDFHFYRSSFNKKNGVVNIAPEGVFLSKQTHGPGVYTVTFAVNESHEKFQYHRPFFVFYFNPPVQNADELKTHMREGSEYLYVIWQKSGLVEFFKRSRTGETEKCGVWIKPGPEKDTAYERDAFVTMTIIVPKSGEDLKFYFNKTPEGVPDCEFEMPAMSANGQFGFYNPKWFSLIHVKDISYVELK